MDVYTKFHADLSKSNEIFQSGMHTQCTETWRQRWCRVSFGGPAVHLLPQAPKWIHLVMVTRQRSILSKGAVWG